ncbi:MAG: DUF4115 domain-containing protein [Ignavibacteriales bacterium]|nr:DUF4115 domain-containing protein [Ignavibacteriales bacterium]
MLTKFAEELKQARLNSNVTLQQMANKTKIDFKFLEAIDEGNFAFLPDIYIRAFIKEYASFIGINPDSTIKKFEAAKKGEYPAEENDKPFLQSIIENEQSEQKKLPLSTRPLISYSDIKENETRNSSDQKRTQILFALIAGITIILSAVIYFLFFNSGDKIIISERPYEESIEENSRYIEQPVLDTSKIESSDSVLTIVSGDSLLLKITSTNQCWVNVIRDDNSEIEFTLPPTSSKIIKAANSFKLILGNSGGIQLSVNNKPLQFEGIPGAVRYVKITTAGVEYLATRPVINPR